MRATDERSAIETTDASVVETEQTFGHFEPDDAFVQIGLDDKFIHSRHIHLSTVYRKQEQRVLPVDEIGNSPLETVVDDGLQSDKVFQIDQIVADLFLVGFDRPAGEREKFAADQFGSPTFGKEIGEHDERPAFAAPLETVAKRGTASPSISTNSGSFTSNLSGKVSYRLTSNSPERPKDLATRATQTVFFPDMKDYASAAGSSAGASSAASSAAASACAAAAAAAGFGTFGFYGFGLGFFHFGFFFQTGFGLSLFVAGEFRFLSCDLAGFLFQPLSETGFGYFFGESAFLYTAQQVFFVEHPFIRKDGPAGVGRLSAFLQPIQSFVEVQSDCSRIGIGVIRPNVFDKLTITWRPAVRNDDMIERITFLTATR